MAKPAKFGLGWFKMPDERDKRFLIKDILPKKETKLTSRYWDDDRWWGNQGATPQCVGYAWTHWREDGPDSPDGPAPSINPSEVYHEAQLIDEWLGEGYDGTSVRAGAKVLKNKGLIEEYRWAWDVATLVDTILNIGPVVVGTYWYTGMFFPDEDGLITTWGQIEGGHAYDINGVDVEKRLFRIKNSWGRDWGIDGYAFISFDDMQKLMNEQGEICLALEVKAVISTTTSTSTTEGTSSTSTSTSTTSSTTTSTTTQMPEEPSINQTVVEVMIAIANLQDKLAQLLLQAKQQ